MTVDSKRMYGMVVDVEEWGSHHLSLDNYVRLSHAHLTVKDILYSLNAFLEM